MMLPPFIDSYINFIPWLLFLSFLGYSLYIHLYDSRRVDKEYFGYPINAALELKCDVGVGSFQRFLFLLRILKREKMA